VYIRVLFLDRVTSLKRLKLIICFYTLEWFLKIFLYEFPIFPFGANRLKSSSASSIQSYELSNQHHANKDIFVDVNLTFELSPFCTAPQV
jgi:hypothetical protein